MKTEWTREEYIKQRAKEHEQDSSFGNYLAMAERDARALEDFGVQWAPEPEPWPGEIAYGVDAGGEPRLALSGSPLRRRRVYGEACRRWKGYHAAVQALRTVAADEASSAGATFVAMVALRKLGEEVPK